MLAYLSSKMTHKTIRSFLEEWTVEKRMQASHQTKSYYKAEERRKVFTFLV